LEDQVCEQRALDGDVAGSVSVSSPAHLNGSLNAVAGTRTPRSTRKSARVLVTRRFWETQSGCCSGDGDGMFIAHFGHRERLARKYGRTPLPLLCVYGRCCQAARIPNRGHSFGPRVELLCSGSLLRLRVYKRSAFLSSLS
jgi:hypothetical protein